MLKFFKRRRPTHRAESQPAELKQYVGYRFTPSKPAFCVPCEVKLSIEDLLVARWFGLTPEQWNDMPAIAKVDKRESYSQAWGMTR